MANSQSPPFDLDRLNQLYGEETVLELLELSINEVSGLLQDVAAAIAGRDSKSLMAAAHQLKGLAATMTFTELASSSLELETASRLGDWSNIPSASSRLSSQFDDLTVYISSILKQ